MLFLSSVLLRRHTHKEENHFFLCLLFVLWVCDSDFFPSLKCTEWPWHIGFLLNFADSMSNWKIPDQTFRIIAFLKCFTPSLFEVKKKVQYLSFSGLFSWFNSHFSILKSWFFRANYWEKCPKCHGHSVKKGKIWIKPRFY